MSLRHYLQTSAQSQEPPAADINRAYIAIKLWLLVIHNFDVAAAEEMGEEVWEIDFEKSGDNFARMIWNELWPPFERVVTSFEAGASNGNIPASSCLALDMKHH
jgi:hypothetical protein